jgi:transposase
VARPYPKELRERVVAAYERKDGTYETLAALFSIGPATVDRWLARYRRTGSVEASPMGGPRRERKVDKEGEKFIADTLSEVPDSSMDELVEAYRDEFGTDMHRSTMARSVGRMGYTRKRGVYAHRKASETTS